MQTRPFVTMSALVLAALGCREEMESPTAPAPADALPAAAATSVATWIARADYPRDIYNVTSASVTDPSTLRTIVYAIGGDHRLDGSGNMTSAVKAYDVSANVWRSRAPYPVRVKSTNGAVEIAGKVYVSGGVTRRWDEQRGVWRSLHLQSLYVYDPKRDTWSRRGDMPFPTAYGVSAAYQGMLYVATPCEAPEICGDDSSEGALLRYNPATNLWLLLTRTPHDAFKAGAGFIGGKFYIGGWQGATDIYDLAANRWSSGPPIPTGGCVGAATTLQGKLYFVGCRDPNSSDLLTLVFDPKLGTWSQAAAPAIRAGVWLTLSRVVVNGQLRLELIGGAVPGTNWQFNP